MTVYRHIFCRVTRKAACWEIGTLFHWYVYDALKNKSRMIKVL